MGSPWPGNVRVSDFGRSRATQRAWRSSASRPARRRRPRPRERSRRPRAAQCQFGILRFCRLGSAWRVFPVGDSFLCAGADEPRGASFRSSRTAFDELLIDDRAHDELRERIRTIPALHGQAPKAAPIALARAAGRMVEQHARARHSWRELATMARAICRNIERLPLGFRSKLLYT